MNKNNNKTVCVIGAGSAGITTIKQLIDEGHQPTCYEKASGPGGAFYNNSTTNSSRVYDNTYLTISNYHMSFSDMPPQGHRRHWHHTEYQKYLVEYINKFDLNKHINYSHQILKTQMIDGGVSGYKVVTRDKVGNEFTKKFDAIAVCNGANQSPIIPEIKGIEEFKGKLIHSSQYKNNDIAKGKKVLCIGLGESSADITREISEVSNNCILGLRSYPYLVPRNIENSSSDAIGTRLIFREHSGKNESLISYLILLFYSLFFGFHFFKRNKLQEDSFSQDEHKDMLDLNTPVEIESVKMIHSWNLLSMGKKFVTKNVSFVPNVLNGKIKPNFSGIKEIKDSSVVFNDGQKYDIDMIMVCTGYGLDFSFIEGYKLKDNNIRNLFMNSIDPNLPNCAFIGFVRPVTGGIPACSEMAARYYSLLLSKKVSLPNNVQKRIENDKKFYKDYLKNAPDYHTVVAWKRYMETFSKLVGCEVNTIKYIFQPSLFVKLFAGGLIPHQYRLEGPHPLRRNAIDTIKRLEITVPINLILNTICRSIVFKIFNEKKVKNLIKMKEIKRNLFHTDIKISPNDLKKYAFRNDNFMEQIQKTTPHKA